MGDEHRGDTSGALNPPDFLPGLQPQPGVQVGQGLVQQQNPGHFHQSPGNGHPLLLTAGELAGLAVHEILNLHQPGGLQGFFRHLLLGEFVFPFPVFQRERDVLLHRQMRVQGIVLKNQTHSPMLRGQIGDIIFPKENPSAGGFQQTGEKIQCGGFSAARGAQQGNELPVGDLQGEIVDGYHVLRLFFVPAGEFFCQMLQDDIHGNPIPFGQYCVYYKALPGNLQERSVA